MATQDDSSVAMRLNKLLAEKTGCSRREADTLIDDGIVLVNGTPAILGARVTSDDVITVHGEVISHVVSYRYLLLNKPVGYVCSRRQQGPDAPTIYALLSQPDHQLKPVGRLDRDSSGAILLTNDGDFAYKMTHPKFYKTKIYEVELDSDLAPLHHQILADRGVQLEDGTSRFQLDRIEEGNQKKWRITMSEGRNRQIRRTFAALGYTVTVLHRTHFGDYALGDMKPGDIKEVDIR